MGDEAIFVYIQYPHNFFFFFLGRIGANEITSGVYSLATHFIIYHHLWRAIEDFFFFFSFKYF